MRISNTILLLLFIASIYSVAVSAGECDLRKVAIDPVASSSNSIYSGKINSTEVRFSNESRNKVIEVFPEPPLLIINKKTKKQCTLDGGIWVRDGVYVSTNEKLLVTHEYTGSNDFLVLHDLTTCKKITEIDISGKVYSVKANSISLGTECTKEIITSCKSTNKIKLNNNCEILN